MLSHTFPDSSERLTRGEHDVKDQRLINYLSDWANSFVSSPLRITSVLSLIEGMASLSVGNPSASTFPIEELDVKLKGYPVKLNITGKDIDSALQYSHTAGNVKLIEELKSMQKALHSPKYPDYDIIISNGCQNLLYMCFCMFLNEGDAIITESPTYPGALAALGSCHAEVIGIDMDADGMISDDLEKLLAEWPAGKKMPKLIYTVPTGGNPSGVLTSTDRKKKIYNIAVKYNILILEDDPYYFLNFSGNKIDSYLSMDEEKLVVRLDSMSKVISPGLRVGYATAPQPVIRKMEQIIGTSLVHASNISQWVVYSALKAWGQEGFSNNVKKISESYKCKCDIFTAILDKYLTGLATWNSPKSGFFVWVKLIGIKDSAIVYNRCLEKMLVICKGEDFYPAGSHIKSDCIRLCFSCSDSEKAESSIKILRDVIIEARLTGA